MKTPLPSMTRGDEFSEGASTWPSDVSRRRFLEIMAASLALGGAGACTRQPLEEIVPYVRQPEGLTLGRPLYFATAMELGGEGCGLLVRSDAGRPTKIEGNPEHPASLGGTNPQMQAALLTLYDPARSQTPLKAGVPSTWEDLLGALTRESARWALNKGAGLRLLTRRVGSPTLRAQIDQLLAKFPKARWHEHDPAFPRSPMPAELHLERARVIVSLDADIFGASALQPWRALSFARARQSEEEMPRLYVVESMPSLTGTMADHRRALRPADIVQFARQLVGTANGSPATDPWVAALVKDLQANKGRAVVVAGDFQPLAVHLAARAINEGLGNTGQTIVYPSAPAGRTADDLPSLCDAMKAGTVEALLIAGPNPVYDAPADLEFAAALATVPFTLHHGLYRDESARHCTWHLPESHFLEAWSDVTAYDGTPSIVQPLIAPLYPSKSLHELLAALFGDAVSSSYDLIHAAWAKRHAGEGFEPAWRRALHDGTWKSGEIPRAQPGPEPGVSVASSGAVSAVAAGALELIIRPDPFLLDGRFAENAWLQELPKPLTKMTWGNAVHLSPATAQRIGVVHGDLVELHHQNRVTEAPAWIHPGHADDCATIHLGYGRSSAGTVGTALGFDAFALQTSDRPWGGPGLEIRRTGRRHIFAVTQEHQSMEARDTARVEDIGHPAEEKEAPPSREETLYRNVKYTSPSWGMVIDLDSCIGCATCTIACQAENNIPVVGREQVMRGRVMHWIRVDSYADGAGERLRMLHQPVPCMHCENAPCEPVCPVGATVHDHEGLNVMVYNRCVGTRYCSNNCPYKVRRFNFLAFNDLETPQVAMMRNPEVTVRMRGVMEKCTYCVQRIRAVRIEADKESRAIRDGEVIPACAQACPTEAITFGDVLDPQSKVSALRQSPRHYALLAELNTRPRTTYLARRRNPHPDLG